MAEATLPDPGSTQTSVRPQTGGLVPSAVLGPAPAQISDAASGGGYGSTVAKLPPLPPGSGTPTPAPGSFGPGALSGASVGSISGVRTYAQLQQAAQDQVNADIAGQEAPLTGQLGTLEAQNTQAQSSLTNLYGSLLPYVKGEADMMSETEQQAQQAQQAIFATANAQMNQQLQSRAQQAQALAQEMGGPVAMGDFMANLGDYGSALSQTGAADQLHALGAGEADVQEASDFAGKVFPLTQVEHSQEIGNYFRDKEQGIRDQIATLEGTKRGAVNKSLNDMLVQERNYALQKNQQAMDAKKNAQDLTIQKHTLANDDRRLELAKAQFGQTAKIQNADVNLRRLQITASEKVAAARLGVSEATLAERIRHSQETESIAKQRLRVQAQKNASQIIAALGTPQKPITLTVKTPVDPVAAATGLAKGNTNIHSDGHGGYYTYTKQTMTSSQWMSRHGVDAGTIGDPQSAFTALLQGGVGRATAIAAVRSKYGKGWKPGMHGVPGKSGPPAPGTDNPGPYAPGP